MPTQRRSARSWDEIIPLGYYSPGYGRNRDLLDSPVRFVLFIIAVFAEIGIITLAIVGIVAVAGGFDPEYMELRYPKPDGYRFKGQRIEDDRALCVDPRDGPSVEWSLVELAEDAVATWRAAAPSLPLTISGICKSAGGDADADGQIRWEQLDGAWGQARMRAGAGDIALSPEISPSSWGCVRNVLLHELGHIIGLGHQDDDLPSIMNPGGCEHEITLFDTAAARHLYEGRTKQ